MKLHTRSRHGLPTRSALRLQCLEAPCPAGLSSAEVQSLFKAQFGALAVDAETFHATLRAVFGPGYDARKAEPYRVKALAGDYGWLPGVKWLGMEVLGGANGAYDADSGTVFLQRVLQRNPALAAATFIEETGHHLDALLHPVDTLKEGGEWFRRALGGEPPPPPPSPQAQAVQEAPAPLADAPWVEGWRCFNAVGRAVHRLVHRGLGAS